MWFFVIAFAIYYGNRVSWTFIISILFVVGIVYCIKFDTVSTVIICVNCEPLLCNREYVHAKESEWNKHTQIALQWAGFRFQILKIILPMKTVYFDTEEYLYQVRISDWLSVCIWVCVYWTECGFKSIIGNNFKLPRMGSLFEWFFMNKRWKI